MNEAHRTQATRACADAITDLIEAGDYTIVETSLPGHHYERIYVSPTSDPAKQLRITIEEVAAR